MLDLPDKVKHYMKSVEKTEKVDYVKLKELYNLFIELENEVKNHSIYVWGGNGETYL